jgi:hypothetical protein
MMHDLTGFTVGTLKKFWPPVKKKVIETYPSYATFIGAPGAAGGETKPAATPKGKGKRKAADEEPEGDAVDADNPDVKTKRTKKAPAEKKVPAKGRAKRVKQEEASDEDAKFKSAEDSADGGDGLGEFIYDANVLKWLENTDCE